MTTLFPPGYGGFPSYQFSPPNQYYNGGYRRREALFAPHYPSQPLYQPPFNPAGAYSTTNYDQFRRPNFGSRLINALNELDEQYRQEQYLRKLEKVQRQYWKLQGNAMPSPPYPYPPPPPITSNIPPGTLYEYEKETEYVPYPIVINPSANPFAQPWNTSYGAGITPSYGAGIGASLPPKIRVIFVPTGQSLSQQPYTGPLAMPPFLYNRISQPLCSFPLPPPLPQLGSLPLTPAVQQMVVQRYSNPVAVLPYSSNWQSPQMMMSGFPQAYPQQPISAFQSLLPAPQSYMPSFMPAYSSLPAAPQPCMALPAPQSVQPYSSLPPAPQSYIPPPSASVYAPMSAYPSLPPAPQAYIPPPSAQMPAYSVLPPAPQAYIPPPMPGYSSAPSAYRPQFPSLPPAPQSYIPAAGAPPMIIIPSNQPVLQSSSSQLSSPHINSPYSSSSDYSNSSYPSLCRACPPAPPPLSISVTGHCWVQHCSACHHVPTPESNPNVRPGGGRITPLLRYPTVPQYVPDQTFYQQQAQYMQANAPVMMRPWLRKTPPLPPGAVVVSDKYYNRDGSRWRSHRSQREHRQHKRGSHHKHRSTTVAAGSGSSTSSSAKKLSRSVSPRRASKTSNNKTTTAQEPASIKSKNGASRASSNTSSSGLSAEYHKTTLHLSNNKKENIPKQLANEARSVNLQYSYQPEEIPSVYHINRYLKSSSETSTVSPNHRRSSDRSSSLTKESSQVLSPTRDLDFIEEESTVEKRDDRKKPPRPPSYSKRSNDKLIIVREFVANSPSTISTISSNATFSIIDKDIDAVSTTSTIEANKLDEDYDLRLEMF